MTFVVESLAPAHAVIQVTHTGAVTASDMRAAAARVVTVGEGVDGWHVLSDFREATQLPGALDMLHLMDSLVAAGVRPDLRQALIWPEDDQARMALDVWRTAETNRGFAAKAFGDREAAIAWLESGPAPSGGLGRSAV